MRDCMIATHNSESGQLADQGGLHRITNLRPVESMTLTVSCRSLFARFQN